MPLRSIDVSVLGLGPHATERNKEQLWEIPTQLNPTDTNMFSRTGRILMQKATDSNSVQNESGTGGEVPGTPGLTGRRKEGDSKTWRGCAIPRNTSAGGTGAAPSKRRTKNSVERTKDQ